jgi:hypothetical protein
MLCSTGKNLSRLSSSTVLLRTKYKEGSLSESAITTTRTWPQRLRLVIIKVGYALAGWALVRNLIILCAWGSLFDRSFTSEIFAIIHHGSWMLCLIAPFVLFAGCWGFQRHLPWARSVLLTYSWMWMVGALGLQIAEISEDFSAWRSGLSYWQVLSFAILQMDQWVGTSLFPFLLILYFNQRELKDEFPHLGRGFAVLPKHEK